PSVDGYRRENAPGVLAVEAVRVAGDACAVEDLERRVGERLDAAGRWQHRRGRLHAAALRGEEETGPHGVRGREHVAALGQERGDLARRVEQVFKVAEAVPLLGRVVDRVVWRRLRDADVVLDVVAGEIVVEAPERAPVLRARLDPGVAAAVHADIPARPKSP